MPRRTTSTQLPPSQITSTQVLYVLLLIAAFSVGYLLAKVQASSTNAVAQAPSAAGTQAGAAPTTAPVHANVGLGNYPIKGNNNAKVTIVEFADLRCPFCKQFFDNVEPQLMKDYVDTGKVKFAFRNYAFLGPASTVAANAAECANDQGKFWDFHDYMYKNQPDETDTSMYNTDSLTQVAGQLGMDTNQFSSCLSANQDSSKVNQDFTDGQKAGVSGTPTFYINGLQLVGAQPYSAFQSAINSALAAK